jgi:O-acetylhomoserine (thiol)-lyase
MNIYIHTNHTFYFFCTKLSVMKKQGFTTRSLNIPFPKDDPHKALQMPVYGAQAFEFETAEKIAANFRGEYIAHVYSRTSNPTVEYFEVKLRELSGAHAALAVSSGMAAISNALFAIAKSGDNIISGNHLFGHTYALFTQTLPDLGIETRFSTLQDVADIESLIDGRTRAIFFETVTNPQLEIADIEMLAKVASRHNLVLIADSTLTPPNVFEAKKHGVHLEVMSTTKYISGGATSFGGAILDYGKYDWKNNPAVATNVPKFGRNAFLARLRKNIYRNTGGSMTAQTALMQISGLDLLELRVERCYKNCLSIGGYLHIHPKVTRVDYPGMAGSPDFEKALQYFCGIPGTIMTFDLESEAACFAFMNRLKIIRRATNLNDNKTLIIHPWSTIYAEFPEEARIDMGIRPTMMRLSVGIEDIDDLIEDIEGSFYIP